MNKLARLMIFGFLALSLSGTVALANTKAPATMKNNLLVDGKGMTLYSFDKDVAGDGKSACAGECTKIWPAFKAGKEEKNTGDFTIISNEDGSKQWAYKGKPLYNFAKDKAPGDKNGDNFKNIWHIVQ